MSPSEVDGKGDVPIEERPMSITTISSPNRLVALWEKSAALLGIELQGSEPVSASEKTDRRYFSLLTLWFSMNFNLIAVSTGMSGTMSYGLGLKECSLIILFFGMLTALSAPYLSLLGVKLGLRQMLHARYAFGLYGVSVPLVLNMATLAGYGIIDCILGGQALSAINPERLSLDGGIVIIAMITLAIILFGVRMLHIFDLYSWFPTLVGILVATGCGGKHLHLQTVPDSVVAQDILSFAALVAGFFLPWSAVASDFTVYFDTKSKKTAIFVPSYIGLLIGGVPLMILGAAIGGAVPNVPSWQEGYNNSSVGGVLGAMLEPAGGFGKFLLALLGLSVLGNVTGSVYALTLNFQAFLRMMRIRAPRVLCTIIVMAIIIPVSIRVAAEFFQSLNNLLGVISYWPACFIAVVLLEHLHFRKGSWEWYDLRSWDQFQALPTGIAALAASVLSFGLVVPGMSQTWYTGPIGQCTGDIGFEVAFVLTALFYLPLRMLEVRFRKLGSATSVRDP